MGFTVKRYQTDFSNEVHQLVVSPSKHFYVAKDRTLKYQKKPFEVNLDKTATSKKNHVIHFLIRDHFSGLFYWEICPTDSTLLIEDFLFRAWSKKDHHPLCGVPDFLTIPVKVQSFFPNIVKFVEKIGITYLKVTSGFQGGVRDIRTVEDELGFAHSLADVPSPLQKDPDFQEIVNYIPVISKRFVEYSSSGPSKRDVWESGFKSESEIYLPKSLESFRGLYQENTPDPK